MQRATALKIASGYELMASAVPAMIEGERLSAAVLANVDDREILQIIEPSFASAHRQVLALASAMTKASEALKAAIERGST